jgi:hypothetical protein
MNIVQCTLKVCCLLVFYIEMTCFKQNYAVENIEFRWVFFLPYVEEEQTTQWPKEKVQKDKQQSTKHTHKTKDRLTQTPLKTGGKLKFIYNKPLH